MAGLKVTIADGEDSRKTVKVDKHNAIRASVSLPELPPSGSRNRTGILNQELTLSAGESNMNVDARDHGDQVAKGVPAKRIGVPADMAGTAIYLASDASSFLTGQTIFVDGGLTAS